MQAFWARTAQNTVSCRCLKCAPKRPTLSRRACAVGMGTTWPLGIPKPTSAYTTPAFEGRWKYQSDFKLDDSIGSELRIPGNANGAGPSGNLEEPPQDGLDDLLKDNGGMALTHNIPPEEESICHIPGYVPLHEAWSGGVDWGRFRELAGVEISDEVENEAARSAPHIDTLCELDWELLSIDSRFPGTQFVPWDVNTGNFVRHHLPPQSLWSYDSVREKALRRRHTAKKILIQETAIGMLIASLLEPARKSARRGLSLDAYSAALTSPLRAYLLLGRLEVYRLRANSESRLAALQCLPDRPSKLTLGELRLKFGMSRFGPDGVIDYHFAFPNPEYSQDRGGKFYEISQEMNASIQRIFKGLKNPSEEDIAVALCKVAHNLFVSSAPPDVHTFNILLVGLGRWSRPNLVNKVIQALARCHIRPNEVTCSAILTHYIRTNDAVAFETFVEKMAGLHDALMLARPDININEAGQARLFRNEKNKVVQKVYPTPLVFNTLIEGVRHFAGLDRALGVYYEMKEDGWGLDVLGLTSLLVHCVRQCDWNNGLYIWHEISTLKAAAQFTHMTKAYANMLSLCTVTGNTAAFNQVLTEMTGWCNELPERPSRNLPKDIVEAAMSFTESLHKERSEAGSAETPPLMPPGTADNVLIAVSAFMDENRAGDDSKEDTASRQETAKARAQKAEAEKAEAEKLALFQTNPEPAAPMSQEEMWEVWLEHELGMKKEETTARRAEKAKSWTAWLSQKLGLRGAANVTTDARIEQEPHEEVKAAQTDEQSLAPGVEKEVPQKFGLLGAANATTDVRVEQESHEEVKATQTDEQALAGGIEKEVHQGQEQPNLKIRTYRSGLDTVTTVGTDNPAVRASENTYSPNGEEKPEEPLPTLKIKRYTIRHNKRAKRLHSRRRLDTVTTVTTDNPTVRTPKSISPQTNGEDKPEEQERPPRVFKFRKHGFRPIRGFDDDLGKAIRTSLRRKNYRRSVRLRSGRTPGVILVTLSADNPATGPSGDTSSPGGEDNKPEEPLRILKIRKHGVRSDDSHSRLDKFAAVSTVNPAIRTPEENTSSPSSGEGKLQEKEEEEQPPSTSFKIRKHKSFAAKKAATQDEALLAFVRKII